MCTFVPPQTRHLSMVLTLPTKWGKLTNVKYKMTVMKKPDIPLIFANFLEKQCNNLEKSNICQKRKNVKPKVDLNKIKVGFFKLDG